MPKIETHSFTHQRTYSTITTDVHFGKMRDHKDYNLRMKKVFFIKLDHDTALYYGKNYVYADTFDAVTKEWEEVVCGFMDTSRSYRKVIAITVSSIMFDELAKKAGMPSKHENSDYSNTTSGRPHLGVDAYPTSRLDLSYHVGYILTVGTKKFWSYYNEETQPSSYTYTPESLSTEGFNHRDWNTYKFIDWTEEREEWIKTLYQSLNKVIAQCRLFYSQKEEDIALQMDKQNNLLTYK